MNILYLRKKSVNPTRPRSSKRVLAVPKPSDDHEAENSGVGDVDVKLDDGTNQLELKNLRTKGLKK